MATETTEILNTEDTLDVRNIIVRYEYLEAWSGGIDDALDDYEQQEIVQLKGLLDQLKGSGGDKQWRGDWYPLTLIRESYFTEYAEELAKDIGAISRDLEWPLDHINWEAAADELRIDYTEVDFDGVTYLTR